MVHRLVVSDGTREDPAAFDASCREIHTPREGRPAGRDLATSATDGGTCAHADVRTAGGRR
jgi:hypothetical protein